MKRALGFTLIELLVVVALVGMMATLTLGYLSDSRKKGADTGVKSNLQTLRAVSEIFYLDNANSYLPAGGSNFGPAVCPDYNLAGTNMFSKNKPIADALAEAENRGVGSFCANSRDFWAVAVGLNLNPNTSWCVDNQGVARVVNATPANAINGSTLLCN